MNTDIIFQSINHIIQNVFSALIVEIINYYIKNS